LWLLASVAWALLFVELAAGRANAQAQVRNYPTQPILVLNTGGHHAPVRSLIFSADDGSQLLSAGMDKLVNVWSLAEGRPNLARTIRPPIWRGYRGVIYAMALSPPALGRDRALAIAGYGVENTRGNIGIFRFPGSGQSPTGDVEAYLPSGPSNDPLSPGHSDTVMGLAFNPINRDILASCSMDATARIWDLNARRTVIVLRGHAGPVNALAFTPDGRRLVTGGQDGVLRLWDAARGTLLAQAAPGASDSNPNDPEGAAILCLAVSSNGSWVVIGRENGVLTQYAAATLRNPVRLNASVRGPVEALAISHDSKRLATSIVSVRNQAADRPRVDCDVEIRAMPGGQVLARVDAPTNLVYAVAFSPGDHHLAYAGGDAQAVYVKDLTDPAKPIAVLAGNGRSLWDVAFRSDSQAVGFARARADLPGVAATYEGFDLSSRQWVGIEPTALLHARITYQGWTIRPFKPLTLYVVNSQNQGYPIALDARTDRRWWSYGFIPPGPGHTHSAVAVGCEGGVAIYVFDTERRGYRRTRFFAGHNGPVYALAPSPDGKWLVSTSSDQTVRLWRLAGCDTVAPLGARIEQPQAGAPRVTAVEPLGFADAMGLRAGDQIELFYLNGKRLDVSLAGQRADSEPPGSLIELRVIRGAERVDLGSTKRDGPALTLFPGLDQEWVLWTPEGYYDTSIIGDRRFLGWQRNRSSLTQPTDYFSVDKFETELHKPEVIGGLWTTADPAQALALLPDPTQDTAKLVDTNRPPSIRIVAPTRPLDVPLVVQAAAVSIQTLVSAEGSRPIRSLRFLVDSRQGPRFDFTPTMPEVNQRAELTLSPGLHRVNVVATNDLGKERTESFDLLFSEAQPRQPRMVVRSVGVSQFPLRENLSINFADRDARDVERFLAERSLTQTARVDDQEALVDDRATAQGIRDILTDLDAKLEQGDLGEGDTVVLMLESHLFRCEQGNFLVGSDLVAGMLPGGSIPTEEITDRLAALADYGCHVLLLLDTVHESTPKEWQSRMNEWARELWKRNVIAFVASNQGPSRRLAFRYRHGAFAQGILESLDATTQSRRWVKPDGPLTLHDFQEAVVDRVQDLTSRKQVAACYVPETLPSQTPFLRPPAPSAANNPTVGSSGTR
jgi:WD40 repeat protein